MGPRSPATTLRAFLTPPPSPQSTSASPMAISASYVAETSGCDGFLLQVVLYIEMQPLKFTTERSKVAFLISLLSGRALSWARAIWNGANSVIIKSYEAFTNHFKELFGSATGELSISDQLLWLHQGAFSTND
ncbi:protein LDOC1-like [Cyprinus carpio]|uniref:Protein LDOC1-like n=1 Tax=Cyprinus carpio TaxID=7962 RepID=A0A9Q9ZCB3_CYPCA|nr:protein LDOC1-like [Cyprinus carpio]